MRHGQLFWEGESKVAPLYSQRKMYKNGGEGGGFGRDAY